MVKEIIIDGKACPVCNGRGGLRREYAIKK